MIKKFIWYFYKPQELNYPKLKLSTITRMFYLAAHIDYENNLRYNNKRYIDIKNIKTILKLGCRETFYLLKILKEYKIINSQNALRINPNIFYKGIIKTKSQLLANYNCIKINIEEVKFLYKQCADSRKHKLLGYIFSLIPYCVGVNNIISVLNKPATWTDIFQIFDYRSKETKTIINNFMSLKLSNGEFLLIQKNNNILINKNFISTEKSIDDIEIDLEKIQNIVDKIKHINKNENINIYLIHIINTDYYKIGCTSDVNKRLSSLQTSNPLKLELIHSFSGGYKVEYYMHKIFQLYNVNNEWFRLPDNYVDLIKQLK